MSLVTIVNPLTRLNVLPNGMNWRGGWSATEQYYKNDVVVSNINQSSYILTGETTSYGGNDPTTNPLWVELSSQSTGIVSVNAGTGISITGNQGTPIVNANNIYSNYYTASPNDWANIGIFLTLSFAAFPSDPQTYGVVWNKPDMITATTGVYQPTIYKILFSLQFETALYTYGWNLNFIGTLVAWDGNPSNPSQFLDVVTFAAPVQSIAVDGNYQNYIPFDITMIQTIPVAYDSTAPQSIWLQLQISTSTNSPSFNIKFDNISTITPYNYLKVATIRLGESDPYPTPP